MPPSLSELKVTPSFCFTFKIPDDRAVTNNDAVAYLVSMKIKSFSCQSNVATKYELIK